MKIPGSIAFVAIFLSQLSCTPSGTINADEDLVYSVKKIWETDTIFATPESVIFDERRNLLYVSNVNGEGSQKDNNGFISQIDTSGNIVNLKWVTGLDGPKGMAILGDTLFVTDIDYLVLIDIPSASIIKKILVENSNFLNDIDADTNGDLFFTDSNRHKIYKYQDGDIEVWLEGHLDRPNGIYVESDRVLVASSGNKNLVEINKVTKEIKTIVSGIGHGDGLVYTGVEGQYLVSDWEGEIFIVFPDNSKQSLLKTKDLKINSADIEFLQSQNVIYVPTFHHNRVVGYELTEQ